jgi:TP901 family phage tail tape measure protein
VGVSAEALDVILRLQGVPTYVGGMREAKAANDEFAASQKRVAAASTEESAALEKSAGAAGLVSKLGKATGIGLVAAMVAGFKSAAKFNQQMELIHTQVGIAQPTVDKLSKSVLGLAKSGQTSQGPKELSEGLYHLMSIGIPANKVMKDLLVTAQGAMVGQANIEHVATALGAAWLVNIKGAGDFHHTLGVLNATVGAGNMRMEQLVMGLNSGLIPISKRAGLSLQDVGAALATLTDSGFSAQSGAAQLGTALHFLYDPSVKARKALESLGLTNTELFNKMSGPEGMIGALKLLKERLSQFGDPAEQAEKLGEILPGGRGKVMVALIEELERYEEKKKRIVEHTSSLDDDIKKSSELSTNRIAKSWSQLKAIFIEFGEAIEGPMEAAIAVGLLALGKLLELILLLTDHGKALVPVIVALASAWGVYKGAVVAAAIATAALDLVGTLGTVIALIPEITSLADAVALLDLAFAANPIGLLVMAVVLGVAAIALAVYEIIKHFHSIINFFKSNWKTIGIIMLGPIAWATVLIVKHWKSIKGVVKDVGNFIKAHWKQIGAVLAGPFIFMWEKAKWVFEHIKQLMSHPGKTIVGGIPVIGGPLASLGHDLGLPGFAHGGYMPWSGYATINENGPGETVWLPGGSSVTPSPANSMSEVRSHTPTPTPDNRPMVLNLEAYLQMPRGVAGGMFKLITEEIAIKEARS